MCQNGGVSVQSSKDEIGKSRVGEDDSHVAFGKKFPGKKRM
jgi:hypothetical protein